MDYHKIFSAICLEFPENIALSAIQIYSLNLALKPSNNFEAKIVKKAKKLLWEMSDSDFDLAVKIWKAIYSWQCCQSLQGLGGCKAKTFKQILTES
jgi:hypothetical protein